MSTFTRPKQVIKDYCRYKRFQGPLYLLVDEKKIDLHKHYTVRLSINNQIISEGIGLSRRIAELKSALNAIHLINEKDPHILEHIKYKYSRTINRSYSADYISQSNRSDSFSSMANGHYTSTSPSIDDIESMTIKNSSIIQNNGDKNHKEKDGETSSDEGVFVEIESSSTLSSPKLPEKTPFKIKEKPLKRSDSKSRLNFLSSFMINPLRAISQRSSNNNSYLNYNNNTKSTLKNITTEENSRPTSSSSSSSASSAFSSNSSISSSTLPTSSIFNQEESAKSAEEPFLINNHIDLINQSILEEEEEDIEDGTLNIERDHSDKEHYWKGNGSKNGTNNSHDHIENCPSINVSNVDSGIYEQNNNVKNGSINNETMVFNPSTSLLRYCVRMYLPLPYYDIKKSHKRYLVTCRIILIQDKNGKLPNIIPKEYINREFTAIGNGDVLKAARNMAAQAIIEKLKTANIYYKELIT